MSQDIAIVHVLRYGKPVCPKCGSGLESEGGSVVEAGSWDYGPLYWECQDCFDEYGMNLQWGHA